MTNNKTVNLIIAIVLAILLWVYVVGRVNPSTKETIKDVQIQLENLKNLEESGLVILSQDKEKVSVVVNGRRNSLNALKAGDIIASCDVSSLGTGEYRVGINIKAPDGITVESMNIQTVKFDVDKVVSQKKPVKFVIINDRSDETEPYLMQTNFDSILVTGPSRYVARVDSLRATVDTDKLTTELQTYSLKLTPVDAEGSEVSDVILGKENVSIAALILGKKTVALDVPIIGSSDDEYTRDVQLPRVITIKGFKSKLDLIESIEAKPINISSLTQSEDIVIVPNLPSDVEVCVESENMVARVTVTKNN